MTLKMCACGSASITPCNTVNDVAKNVRVQFLEAARSEYGDGGGLVFRDDAPIHLQRVKEELSHVYVQGWRKVTLRDLLEGLCCVCLVDLDGKSNWCPECFEEGAFYCVNCCKIHKK